MAKSSLPISTLSPRELRRRAATIRKVEKLCRTKGLDAAQMLDNFAKLTELLSNAVREAPHVH